LFIRLRTNCFTTVCLRPGVCRRQGVASLCRVLREALSYSCFSCTHLTVSGWLQALLLHLSLFHGQPCSRAHVNTSSCPSIAATCTCHLIPRASALPRPLEYLEVPSPSGVCTCPRVPRAVWVQAGGTRHAPSRFDDHRAALRRIAKQRAAVVRAEEETQTLGRPWGSDASTV
jgi:hypothetical protein